MQSSLRYFSWCVVLQPNYEYYSGPGTSVLPMFKGFSWNVDADRITFYFLNLRLDHILFRLHYIFDVEINNFDI